MHPTTPSVNIALYVLIPLILASSPAVYAGEAVGTEAVRVEPAAVLASTPATSAPVQVGQVAVSPAEALSALGVGVGTVGPGNEFLPPDLAFLLNIELTQSNTIVARWQISDTYYLYRDKFRFTLRDTPGAALGDVVIPAGTVKNDPYFGPVEVFYETAQAAIALQGGETSTTGIILDVTYQGCTDLGLCYPPITKSVTLTVPPSQTE